MAKFEYTKEHIKSSKLALLLGAITAGVADIFVVVLLMIAGLWSYIALPIVLAVADIAFLTVALFTNFRFRYSMTYVITYLAIFIGCVIGHFLVIRGGAETAMTAIALIIWVVVHILNFIVIMLGAKGALTKQKSHHFVTALVVMLFIASVGVYIGFGSAEGYFGQGSLTARPIVYVYDEKTDSYTATGVLDGSGKFAVIPEKFDGKPVRAIDSSLFTAKRLERLEIQSGADLTLLNLESLKGITVQEITAPRETLTAIQRELYTAYRDGGRNEELITLASLSTPSDLEEGEIYITFTYTDTALECIGDAFLPSWIGHKNDRFSLSALADNIDYIKNTDNTDEALLHELYTSQKQGSGYILLPIMLDAKTPLNGATVQKSHKNVVVDFEKIYRVEILEDNDSLYTMPHSFTSIFANGEDIAYRYVTPSTIGNLLSTAEKREGFTISWNYGYGNGFTLPEATTTPEALLSALDGRDESKFTVKPTWVLNAPAIQSVSANKNGAFTYGDRASFTVNATAPAPGTVLSYEWYFDGNKIATTESYEIPVILMDQNGEYTVKVYASSPTVTSLTSDTSSSTTVTVSKKEIDITWLGIEDTSYVRVYDSLSHNIEISYNENDLVTPTGEGRDTLTFDLSQSSVKGAGSYEITITLTGDADTKYTLRQNDKKQVYEITQKPVSIEWSNLSLTYNAKAQKPSVIITEGICSGDSVTVNVTEASEQIKAGTYYANATLNNSNYKIAESATKQFTIEKKQISITWSEESEYTYNRNVQGPTPSTTGIESLDLTQNNIALTRVGAGTEAGEYTVGVTINSDNYYIIPEGSTKTYTIVPKTISVDWATAKLEYNAMMQYPTTTLRGVVSGDNVPLSYAIENGLGAINVGEYTVVAQSQNPNYILDTSSRHTYAITKATVTVTWSNNEQTYAAKELLPTYTINGMKGSDTYGALGTGGLSIAIILEGAQRNVCTGAKVTMTYESDNYFIEESTLTTTLTVKQKEVTLLWTNNTFIYNAQAQLPTVTIVSGTIEGESLSVEASGAQIIPGTGYKATATLSNSNYVIKYGQQEFSFTITKKSLSPVWSNTEFSYNGTAHNPTVVLEGIVDVDRDKVTYALSAPKSDAGTHTATVSLTAMSDCYELSSTTKQFTVAQAVLTPNWSNLEFTYDKTSHQPTVTFDGIFGTDEVYANFNRGAATDADSYVFTVSVSNGNYTINEDKSRTMVIHQAILIPVFTGNSFVYNGKVQAPSYEFIGLLGSDKANETLNATGKNKGEYTATLIIGNKNYTVENTASLSFSYSITAAPITIEWGNNAFVFDNTLKFPAYTLSGIVSGENESMLGAIKSSYKNAGNYPVTYEITNANYTVTNPEWSMSIAKREVTPNFTKLSFPYSGSAQVPLYTVETISGYDYKSDIVPSAGNRDAGSYTFTLTLNDENVTLVNASTEYTITPIEITVNWTNYTLTYNGMAQRPTATTSGILAVDNGMVSLSVFGEQTYIGSYTAVAQINSDNYTIRSGNESRDFTISAKKVNITWTNYSGLVYNGSVQAPVAAFASNAIYEGDTVEIIYLKNGETDAGTYTMEIELNNDNYEIASTYASRSYTISPKSVTVTWSNYSGLIYNGTVQLPKATVTLIDNQTVELDVTCKSASGVTTSPVDAGSYTATATYDNKNYTLSGATKSFTIMTQDLTISWNVGNYTYYTNRGQAPTASATLADGTAADLTIVYRDEATGTTSATKPVDAGTYTAIASYSDSNYTVKKDTQSFTIQKFRVSIIWNGNGGSYDIVYDGQVHNFNPVAQDVSGASIGFNVTIMKDGKVVSSIKEPGTYTLTATPSKSSHIKNYDYENSTLTVVVTVKN